MSGKLRLIRRKMATRGQVQICWFEILVQGNYWRLPRPDIEVVSKEVWKILVRSCAGDLVSGWSRKN